MIKRLSIKLLSVFMTLCMIVSMIAVGMISASANFFADFALEKMMDIGMRTVSKVTDEIIEATGGTDTGAGKTFSFINNILLKDASEVGIEKVAEMCEEILAELDYINENLKEGFDIIEESIADSEIRKAKSDLDYEWNLDVTQIFNNAGSANSANSVQQNYITYLRHALQYKDDPDAPILTEDYKELLNSFASFGGISLTLSESNDISAMEAKIFPMTDVNAHFTSLIDNLSLQLKKSGSVSERIAQYAYLAYPFSHQQRTVIYQQMEQQLMQIIFIEMAYNEFLFRQGEYIKAHETHPDAGEGKTDYDGYLGRQSAFYDLMTGQLSRGENCVNKRIEDMLSAPLNFDTSSKATMTLDDYMRPEDAVSVPLTIRGYEKNHNFGDEVERSAVTSKGDDSYPKYISETVWFKRVMTHSPEGDSVYYIIDPDKLEKGALDVHNYKFYNDLGTFMYCDAYSPTCDYINLIKPMVDGENTFAVENSYDCAHLQAFFNTNAFLAGGSKVNTYLDGYLASSDGNVLTAMRRYNNAAGGLYHQYVKYKVLLGGTSYSTGVKIYSDDGKDERGHDEIDTGLYGDNDPYQDSSFTVILANQSDVFNSKISSQVKNSKSADLIVTAGDSSIHNGESMTLESGTMLDIKVNANGEVPNSLKVVRGTSEIIIADKDDFENLKTGDDGCYHLTYSSPYSDATFVLDVPDSLTATIGTIKNGTGSFSLTEDVTVTKAKPGDKVDVRFTGDEYYTSILIPKIKDAATGDELSVEYAFSENYTQNNRYTEIYWFIMPDKNVVIETEFGDSNLHTARIENFTGGTASFSRDSVMTEKGIGEWVWSEFYVTASKNYGFENLKITDKKGRDINFSRSADNVIEGDTITYSIGFQMTDCDVTITGSMNEGITVTPDSSKFVNSGGEPVAYIELRDYQNNGEYTRNPVIMPSYTNSIEGRFVYDDNHYPVNIKVVGEKSGKVFVDRSYSEDAVNFFCINSEAPAPGELNAPAFGEDLIVIPSFGTRNEPVTEPTEPATEPTEPPVPQIKTYTAAIGNVPNGTGSFSETEIVPTVEDIAGTELHCWFTGEPGYTSIWVPTFRDADTNEEIYVKHDFVDYHVDNDVYTYEFLFTLPDRNVIVDSGFDDSAMHTATIGEFTGGTASFDLEKTVKEKRFSEYSKAEFYVGAPKNYTITDLKITDSTGKDVSFNKGADNIIEGDNIIYTISFQMPTKDVTITGSLTESFTASVDSSKFVYDGGGEAVAYIELKDYQNNNEYTKEPINIASYMNSIQGRYIYDADHYPTHLKAVGKDTGKVFYDKDTDADDKTFNVITPDNNPFGEDILVIPSFGSKTQPTEPATEPSTEPEPESHGIRTYDELCEFAQLVNGGKTADNAYLENNILAPDDSVWTDGIGANGNAFNGTFDGKGYYIVGLNVNNAANGGLFDTIGKNGVVKDLAVIDCDFSTLSANAGGIAAVNEGTIDHCTSGVNLSGKTHFNGKTIDVAAYNSFVYGTQSGGIASVNKGVITGSRNGATVSGAQCGGIACINEGTIYACANNGAVGREERSCKFAGGLAGENNAKIESSYNSGKVNCNSIDGSKGFVAAANNSDDVKNNFYPDFNSIAPVGSGTIDSTNKLVKNSEMQKEAFVDSLNAVTDDSATWTQTKYGDTFFNQGYPTILGRYLKQRALSLTDNIKISGMMHGDLQIDLHTLAAESEDFEALAEKGNILSAYRVDTTDLKGNFVPSELWSAGGYQLTLPTGGKSIALLAQNTEGDIVTLIPDKTENGAATFTVGDMISFAVTDDIPALLGDVNLDGTVDTVDATLIQRYDAKMIELSAEALAAADVDSDGEVTIIDATWIQRYDVKMKAPEGIGKPIS